jgi:hypothetical protein
MIDSALISVHGKYCKLYDLGVKRVEVRKFALKKEIKYVYIYNTEKKVIQFMAILESQETIPIQLLTEEIRQKTGLERLTYFLFSKVGNLFPSVDLKKMKQNGIHPPVDCRYLTNDEVNFIHSI